VADHSRPRRPIKPRKTLFTAWITQVRLNRGLCTHEVAALMGKNPGRIAEIEGGTRLPTPEEFQSMLRIYGLIPPAAPTDG
jgi:hypothetical protein